MRHLWTSFIVASTLTTTNCKTAGKERPSEAKIIGGQTSQRLPQVGMIKRMGGAYCTGTLITPDTVVTAAHCLVDAESNDLYFVMNSAQDNTGVQLAVASFKMHPKYDHKTNNYDIGLIKLASKAPFPPLGVVKQLDPITLIGQKLTAVGYGRAKKPSEASIESAGTGIKREVDLTVTAVNDSKIRVEEPSKSACNGDSGGAYLQISANGEPLLAGVTSCGDADCSSYGVATRIDVFLDFLGLASGRSDIALKNACDSSYNEGVCDNDTVKICRNDCYELTLKEQLCQAGKRCRKDPFNGLASCYDPALQQKINLTFRQLKVVEGRYESGAPLTDLYLFLDRSDTNDLPRMGEHSLLVTPSGSLEIELELGDHSFEGIIFQGSSGVAYVPARSFKVDRNSSELSFTLPTDIVQIEVPDDVGFDHAVYITGQGDLLGNWLLGEKLRYNSKKKAWIYTGTLARNLEFKLFKSAWADDTHIDLAGRSISWEALPGNHRIGEGGLPYNGGFQHKITGRFR